MLEIKWDTGNVGIEWNELRETGYLSENWVLHTLFSVCHRSRVYDILFMCWDFLIYSRHCCACSDQLHFGGFCTQAAVWLTAVKFIMAAFEMSVGDSLCKTSTTDRGGGQEESWDGWKNAREKIWKTNAGNYEVSRCRALSVSLGQRLLPFCNLNNPNYAGEIGRIKMLLFNCPSLVAQPFCRKLLHPGGEETEPYLFPCIVWQLASTTSEDIETGESDACSFFWRTS